MALETLRSSCSHLDGRRLWLGKAALRSRVVAIQGWRGARRLKETISLEDVELVARLNDKATGNLIFVLEDGTERTLRVSAPGIWRMQIEYRLRRIAAKGAEAAGRPSLAVDPSLPTADDVETDGGAEMKLEATGSEELAAWPLFESEEATIEIVDETEPDFLIEPVAVSDDGSLVPDPFFAEELEEADAPAESEEEAQEVLLVNELSFDADNDEDVTEAVGVVGLDEADTLIEEGEIAALDLPSAEDLHEIGDDVVFDVAMDASTHEDVVLDWLEPVGAPEAVIEVEAPETEIEVEVPEADLEIEAPEAVIEVEVPEAELEVEAPEAAIEVEVPEAELEQPEAVIELEAPEVELEAELPEAVIEVEVPEAELEVETPEAIIEPAEVEAEAEPHVPDDEPREVAAEPEMPQALEIELEPLPEDVPVARLSIEPADLEVRPASESLEEVEPEERARLPIASRPFDLVKLYESVDQEQAVEPEDLREAEL
ncbi:MAG: hypothetical protein HKN29_03210, partial [Rhodothermales bacterium]|nr:hypothetical protein [Rhodothermales bacterium]